MPKVGQGEYLLNIYLGSCFTNCFSFTDGKATESNFPQIFQKLPRKKSGFLLNLWIFAAPQADAPVLLESVSCAENTRGKEG